MGCRAHGTGAEAVQSMVEHIEQRGKSFGHKEALCLFFFKPSAIARRAVKGGSRRHKLQEEKKPAAKTKTCSSKLI